MISKEILNIYPKGLKELFEFPSPKEDDVYILSILFCPKSFHQNYKEYSKAVEGEGLFFMGENENEIENNRLKDFIDEQNKKIGILNVKKELPENQKQISKKLESSNAEIELLKKSVEKMDFGSDDIFDILIEDIQMMKIYHILNFSLMIIY